MRNKLIQLEDLHKQAEQALASAINYLETQVIPSINATINNTINFLGKLFNKDTLNNAVNTAITNLQQQFANGGSLAQYNEDYWKEPISLG